MTGTPDRFSAFVERAWWVPLALALSWLALAWSAAIAIDIHNLGGMQDWMLERFPHFPLAWYYLFSEAHPTEWLQWILQTVGLIAAVILWRGFKEGERVGSSKTATGRLRTGWFLLAAGLFVMFMEDSQNVRHIVSDSFLLPFFEPRGLSSRRIRLVWELAFYLFLAGLMGTGLLQVLRAHRPDRRTLGFLIAGYGLYGLAGFSSAARGVLDWQVRLGNWVIARWQLLEIRTWAEAQRQLDGYRSAVGEKIPDLGFMITDHWFEESLELLSAGILISGFLLLAREVVIADRNHFPDPKTHFAPQEQPSDPRSKAGVP